MNIRKDLQDVESLISRLISLGQEFASKDDRWVHMKNNEDFHRVWELDDQVRRHKIEEIYGRGREIAGFMSESLQMINVDFTTYPTLTSVIERFNGTWIYDDLDKIKNDGKLAHDELGLDLWSFRQMLVMFQDQIDLTKIVKSTLALLKESDLYKLENGLPMKEKTPTVSISNVSNSNIAVSSDNTNQNIGQNDELFIKIIDAITNSEIKEKDELIAATKEMEAASKSGGIAEQYKNFIALAANHMSIVAPFIPALSVLL